MKQVFTAVLAALGGVIAGAAGMAMAVESAAPKAYYVGNVQEVKDTVTYRDYATKVQDTINPFGGRFIVRGAEPVILDASRKPPGYIVVIEFPNMRNLRAWWDSPIYSGIRPIRERLTTGQNYAVEGVPPG